MLRSVFQQRTSETKRTLPSKKNYCSVVSQVSQAISTLQKVSESSSTLLENPNLGEKFKLDLLDHFQTFCQLVESTKESYDRLKSSSPRIVGPPIRRAPNPVQPGFLLMCGDREYHPSQEQQPAFVASMVVKHGHYSLLIYPDSRSRLKAGIFGNRTNRMMGAPDQNIPKPFLFDTKVNPDLKSSQLTFHNSVEAQGGKILEVASSFLVGATSEQCQPSGNFYLASVEHIPPGSDKPEVVLTLIDSITEVCLVLLTSEAAVSHTQSYLQLMQVNDRPNMVLMTFKKSDTELMVLLAPANQNPINSYLQKPQCFSVRDAVSITDFWVSPPHLFDNGAMSSAAPTFKLVCLAEPKKTGSEAKDIPNRSQSLVVYIADLPYKGKHYLEPVLNSWKAIECSRFNLHQMVEKLLPLDWEFRSAKVRFCSKLNTVFLFGTGEARSPPTEQPKLITYWFVVAFQPEHLDEPQIVIKPSVCKTPSENIYQKFMIAENPGLRRPTGFLSKGPQNHPLFVVGVQYDDTIFAVYFDGPTGAKPLRVEDARDYFMRESTDQTVFEKGYEQVTSISWVETPHGDKFTIADNSFSVITFGLNSYPTDFL